MQVKLKAGKPDNYKSRMIILGKQLYEYYMKIYIKINY